MKYFYEYMYKKGSTSFIMKGSNLKYVLFSGNYIKLYGEDFFETINGFKNEPWSLLLDINKIVYFKIWPMLDDEGVDYE